jgi:hypothetical protein
VLLVAGVVAALVGAAVVAAWVLGLLD